MIKQQKKRGKPPKPLKERIESIKFDYNKIEELAGLGLTDVEIGNVIGVSEQTINRWKAETDFELALKRGKDRYDAEAVKCLHKRVTGYRYDEITKERNKTTGKLEITKIITKEIIPDTTACLAWLNNRRKQDWRQNPDNALQNNNGLSTFVKSLIDNCSQETPGGANE